MIEFGLKYGVRAHDEFLKQNRTNYNNLINLIKNCNEFKKRAKDASNYSNELFLSLIIKQKNFDNRFDAIVSNINENNIELYIPCLDKREKISRNNNKYIDNFV